MKPNFCSVIDLISGYRASFYSRPTLLLLSSDLLWDFAEFINQYGFYTNIKVEDIVRGLLSGPAYYYGLEIMIVTNKVNFMEVR